MTHTRPSPSALVGVVALLCSTFSICQSPAHIVLSTGPKPTAPLVADQLRLQVAGHAAPITSLSPLAPSQAQVALLIDDGLRSSLGRQIPDIQQFLRSLPAGVEVLVGYMQNGRIVVAQPFTTEHAAAAAAVRLPLSAAGLSGSPYLCISDFAKHWPKESEVYAVAPAVGASRKYRLVLMLTNGVDPYNGSVSPINQDSPYVQAASTDAQRAGISVSSIYYGDSGIGGGLANLSGQSYLLQIAQDTGGISYYNMRSNPVSLSPYFNQFISSLNHSYIATFDVPEAKGMVSIRFRSQQHGVKLHAPQSVRGN